MGFSKQVVYIGDFKEEAAKRATTWGLTDLYSTGDYRLDEYLGGGFGRDDAYEIVLLYGSTGIGKSTVALNMVAPAIKDGKRVGLMILEDDMADASLRLSSVLGQVEYSKMNAGRNVICIPKESMSKSWTLDDLLELINQWFTTLSIDIILLDHLQFAFEGAESIKGENEYIAQRIFMQKLNDMVKKLNKTIILVSHINKDNGSKGLNKIVGSGAIAQASTKAIEVSRNSPFLRIRMWKSRFTETPDHAWDMKLTDGKLESAS